MDELDRVLVDAQARGLIGPAPVADHRAHARGFLVNNDQADRIVDLGSGGGVPGLVLAWEHDDLRAELIDGRRRSTDWLLSAVAALHLDARVRVTVSRAEDLGRDPHWRGSWPLVVARGFGGPAVTAECGAPLLAPGGALVVSDPPTSDPARWPEAGLATLGLAPAETWSTPAGHYARFHLVTACPDRFPRRVGIPAKRPLW